MLPDEEGSLLAAVVVGAGVVGSGWLLPLSGVVLPSPEDAVGSELLPLFPPPLGVSLALASLLLPLVPVLVAPSLLAS